jgi:hypothetical protein
MKCEICDYDYYKNTKKKNSSISRCEYMMDNGIQCCKKAKDDDILCALHIKNRIEIKCNECGKGYCRICYKKYFLNEVEEKCMNCGKAFSIEYILGKDENNVERFNKEYVWGILKEHKENILLDSMWKSISGRFPTLQKRAKLEKEIEEYEEDRLRVIKHLNSCVTYLVIKIYKDQLTEINLQLSKKQKELEKEIKKLENFTDDNTTTMVGKCEKCNGYINNKWICELCGINYCEECHMVKINGEHKCKEEDIESVKTLEKLKKKGETKECPGCKCLISKIQGCNQMWCINCHCFFDWSTGKIINTRFLHNPHYIEWLDKNRDSNTMNKNEILFACIKEIKSIKEEQMLVISENYRLTIEIKEEVEMDRNNKSRNLKKSIDDLVVKYLKIGMETKELKKFLQRIYKKEQKIQVTNDYKIMYSDKIIKVLEDIKNDNGNNVEKYIEILGKNRKDADNDMINIGRMFKSSVPKISQSEYDRNNQIDLMYKYIKKNTCMPIVYYSYSTEVEILLNLTGTKTLNELNYYIQKYGINFTDEEILFAVKKVAGYQYRRKVRTEDKITLKDRLIISLKRYLSVIKEEEKTKIEGMCIGVLGVVDKHSIYSNMMCRRRLDKKDNIWFCKICMCNQNLHSELCVDDRKKINENMLVKFSGLGYFENMEKNFIFSKTSNDCHNLHSGSS